MQAYLYFSLSCRLHLCSVRSIPGFGDISAKFGMVWRFLPMADPLVDVMVSRDLDSRYCSKMDPLTAGMVWRFLPMADPLVDVMVSRHLDSR